MSGHYRAPPGASFGLLLGDLEHEISRIDQHVFAKAQHPVVAVVQISDVSTDPNAGFRVGRFVSYLPVQFFHSRFDLKKGIPTIQRQLMDTYGIWQKPTTSWLEKVLVGGGLPSGDGHFEIKEQWFHLAVAVVRARVIAHREWFPEVQLRTRRSLLRHRNLFAEGGDEFSGARRLSESFILSLQELGNNPIAVDVYWTLELVQKAKDRGIDEERALALLTSEEL